ncbi:phosphate acetyltransferase [Pseudolactococcus insecticola]|uniref:Phosphate acetyltransferase n=1 Tax=Pseudolactococcus insecticola TaxID=2709158 RepID=A0A6A0B416_9LACT|nr:phosphate acetyltransferase [Lactococcus insecticola]GFH39786.1 phosphate acetyltransferase [Lactococcus insecticola]
MKNDLFDGLKGKIAGKNLKIVFPEGIEPRIIGAAYRLQAEQLLTPILLGNVEEISATLRSRGLQSSLFTIIDPANYDRFDEMVESFVARRNGKVTAEAARETLLDVNYFGTMLVYMGIADGLVSGAIHSTADTVRPALQIIKTKPGISRTSGAFLMVRAYGQEKYVFSDCAINIDPTAQELAEIAIDSADTARLFDIEPRVAMLSFSTNGSGASDDVTKVVEATKLAKELRPDLALDGEMQFDAAFVPEVGRLKFPDSKVAGNASVFVFPDLQSGNIGYKIAQRLGNFEAIGPILQGLNKPVSDLSRGSNEEDVYKLSIITAAQALM